MKPSNPAKNTSKNSRVKKNLPKKIQFFSQKTIRQLAQICTLPAYVYSEKKLQQAATELQAMPHAYGLTLRFAIKADPNKNLLTLFDKRGLHFLASSTYETERILLAGIAASKILITSQEPIDAPSLRRFLKQGAEVSISSLYQLLSYAKAKIITQKTPITLRLNIDSPVDIHYKTNVSGRTSSFGIWHEHIASCLKIASQYKLHITRLHIHAASGINSSQWLGCAKAAFKILHHFPEVRTLNLGGGFKARRDSLDIRSDIKKIGTEVKQIFIAFYAKHGRKLALEIEPGGFLTAEAGVLLAQVADIVTTGPASQGGRNFLKLNAGMNDLIRPSLYGSRHEISLIPMQPRNIKEKLQTKHYIVVGHCCENGDLFTPEKGNPNIHESIKLPLAKTGDYVLIGAAGGYGSALSSNYNSFPLAAEYLLASDGQLLCIRKRQTLQQITGNEIRQNLGLLA